MCTLPPHVQIGHGFQDETLMKTVYYTPYMYTSFSYVQIGYVVRDQTSVKTFYHTLYKCTSLVYV